MGHTLEELLADRVAQATTVDSVFTRDVAERVSRFTLDGGRRMRSQFLWWSMRACGGAGPEMRAALRTSAALELIQTCALIHDDVMDGSSRRRGRPSFHAQMAAQYPESVRRGVRASPFASSAAILAGDLALAWADDVMAETEFPPGTRRRVLDIWRTMRTEMVAGQYLDLHGQTTGSRSIAQAIRTAYLKTALYSVERPLAFGAALAGADTRTTQALCSAGRCAGIAFQLRDDLDGAFGDSRRTGKPSGDDIRAGKVTYLVTVARARAEARADSDSLAVLDSMLGDSGLSPGGLARVRAVLVATGARSVVESRIERLLALSSRHLSDIGLPRPASRRLSGLLYAVAAQPAGEELPPDRRCSADGTPAALLLAGASAGPVDGARR
ncbi:polyprenyl synthetase family protein [Streptomyces sp. NPDC051219]|uniref:polyprenyl synthetase family protein n=1 Tax=Streptomyces sp. NPDC051219 TaxID=3155283 RepID=UPI0034152A08